MVRNFRALFCGKRPFYGKKGCQKVYRNDFSILIFRWGKSTDSYSARVVKRTHIKKRTLQVWFDWSNLVIIFEYMHGHHMAMTQGFRNRIWRRFRVFCLLSVKVCSWYKTHSNTGIFAGVRYVFFLSVPDFNLDLWCRSKHFPGTRR